jgi:hypothetical protein
MAKASKTTNRRAILAAVPAVAVMAALPSLSAGADPIFVAIDRHRDATVLHAQTCEEADEHGGPDWDEKIMATMRAGIAAKKTLIATLPTTREGLLALEEYLRHNHVGVPVPVTFDDGLLRTEYLSGPKAVDWFIAQRASEMSGGPPPRALNFDDAVVAIKAAIARWERDRLTA